MEKNIYDSIKADSEICSKQEKCINGMSRHADKAQKKECLWIVRMF